MEVLDKKVQLAILDQVANNREGNVVRIDSLTLEKQFNFKYLADKNCLQPVLEPKTEFWHEIVGATTLTEKGQEFRLKLIEELEIIELRRQSVKAFEEGNRKAEEANKIARIPHVCTLLQWRTTGDCWMVASMQSNG